MVLHYITLTPKGLLMVAAEKEGLLPINIAKQPISPKH